MTKIFLDPDIVEMVRFLDPETTEILLFLDPEIVKMDKKNFGSRNCRNGVISGSRNRRKGRQILYRFLRPHIDQSLENIPHKGFLVDIHYSSMKCLLDFY